MQKIKICKCCGAQGDDGVLFRKNRLLCKQCENRESRERQAHRRESGQIKAWRDSGGRELCRKLKEKYRREAGARPRSVIHAEAIEKRENRRKLADEYWSLLAERKQKSMTKAEKYKKRYWEDLDFREKQKKRVSEAKRTVPYWYANQLLGGSSIRKFPEWLVLAKQIQKRVGNLIKELRDAKH